VSCCASVDTGAGPYGAASVPFFAGTRVVSWLYVMQFETGCGVPVLVGEFWGTGVT
jgi:hypothetical protein